MLFLFAIEMQVRYFIFIFRFVRNEIVKEMNNSREYCVSNDFQSHNIVLEVRYFFQKFVFLLTFTTGLIYNLWIKNALLGFLPLF